MLCAILATILHVFSQVMYYLICGIQKSFVVMKFALDNMPELGNWAALL